ncbi:MAG TPA: universal stress protein [Solirubrobacterales bacterium]|jgi:nucleotide-binding universal stress UspA family protein|nr:universal stress protein [Solirubrobacterales bacterium]
MRCYHNILVALDGSPDAEAALRHAVALALDQHARLTLVTVAPLQGQAVGTGAAAVPDPVEAHEKVLRQATDSLPRDVGVTTRLERGNPAERILRLAGEGNFDLIVMGSHGHSRVHRALIGSVSEKVLQTSRLPVLLMRRTSGDQPPSL